MHKKSIFLFAIFYLFIDSVYSQDNYYFRFNIPEVHTEMLYPEFWINNTDNPDILISNYEAIQAYNRANVENCLPVVDLENYSESFTKKELINMITKLSSQPENVRYDEKGNLVTSVSYSKLTENLNLENLRKLNRIRYGLVVKRTEMRTFPTHNRIYNTPDSLEYDRFMETAVYPAEPIIILSVSKDGKWYFAQMYNYLAWINTKDVALTDKDTMIDYINTHPFLIITGAYVHTNYNPLNKNLSNIRLDMGVRVPLASSSEIADDIYGQSPAGNFVVKLPTRNENGNVVMDFALIPILEDVTLGYLPYTRANIIKQSFKLQGERYGWGGTFNGRDCTAFIMDIFRTMGIMLPRNSSEQGKLASGVYYEMSDGMSEEGRKHLFNNLEAGTALYMGGHAMLYLGEYNDECYAIHNFSGFELEETGMKNRHFSVLGVAVTPLSILTTSGETFLEALYGAKVFILE